MERSALHWLEISQSALLHNLSQYKKIIKPKTKIMAMVKANAYGHGLTEVVTVLKHKVDFFAVNTIQEALVIRNLKLGQLKILVVAPISPSDFPLASKNNISLCAHSLDYLNQLQSLNHLISLHLKINTGTNRLGLSPIELLTALEILRHNPNLKVEGIYTHFHSSDSGSPQSLIQLDMFNQAVFQTKYYFPDCLAHCSSSSSALLWSQTSLDMIRVGIALYGLWPDTYIKAHVPKSFTLKPVLSWKCRSVQIRPITAGETVGYSATHMYKQPGVMAVLPIGYSDGLDRKLSNTGRVWFNGSYCPIIGRIAMNFTAIDITEVKGYDNADPQNIVEIIGPHVTADELAKLTDTINYEVVSRLNPQIPRQIVI